MRAEISDYALLGDTRTAALVSQDGSMPRPGKPGPDSTARRIVRLVIGRGGCVPMWLEFAPRFGYGLRRSVLDWAGQDLLAADGHDTLRLCTSAGLKAAEGTARFAVLPAAGRGAHPQRGPRLRPPAGGAGVAGLAAARRGQRPGRAADRLRPRRRVGPAEQEVSWLPGHHGASPVRIGNGAASQFQMDVYGEIADAQCALVLGNGFANGQQQVVRRVLADLERAWRKPDEGIWEIRGPRQHFTYSKVMAWTAFDRAVKLGRLAGLGGPHRRWRALRDEIHAEVCRRGFDTGRNSFVQSYGSA